MTRATMAQNRVEHAQAHAPGQTGLFAIGQILCCINRVALLGIRQTDGPAPPKNNAMTMNMEDSQVLQKTKELCQTLLDEPAMQAIRNRIDAFMGDEQSRAQYEELVGKGQELQQKQQTAALTGEEIEGFNQSRDALFRNPVARGFLDAQEELQQIQQTVQRYINKTLELGRMPTEADLHSCSEHGCSCGH